jgi:hypothetical protein
MHPQIVLGTYEGQKYDIKAPGWTKRKPGRVLVFRETKAHIALLFSRMASEKASDKVRFQHRTVEIAY